MRVGRRPQLAYGEAEGERTVVVWCRLFSVAFGRARLLDRE
ncbi:MAG: DM13 domain-containing protein [Actinobacteria bacterium]|nr:MAG: DM13 domain-containing protein [Actinomycetota bacterium]